MAFRSWPVLATTRALHQPISSQCARTENFIPGPKIKQYLSFCEVIQLQFDQTII